MVSILMEKIISSEGTGGCIGYTRLWFHLYCPYESAKGHGSRRDSRDSQGGPKSRFLSVHGHHN